MNHLTLYPMDDWACFRTSNKSFIACVKSGITPLSYRKYDASTQSWLVWKEKVPDLIALASRFFEVDASRIPDEWVTGKPVKQVVPRRVSTAHSVLHLLDSAPFSVVKASYKALLREYHPDHNGGRGDQEKLNKVIEAYREIEAKHK